MKMLIRISRTPPPPSGNATPSGQSIFSNTFRPQTPICFPIQIPAVFLLKPLCSPAAQRSVFVTKVPISTQHTVTLPGCSDKEEAP